MKSKNGFKNNMPALAFKKSDLIAVFTVLALAVIVFLLCLSPEKDEGESVVSVYLDGRLYAAWPLDADGEYTVKGKYTNTISVKDGKASVTHSDCPGSDCVNSGSTSSSSKSIVCLPNRMELTISLQQDEVDFTVR